MAHPEGHDMEYVRAPSTSELAREAVVKLVARAKLPASWARARVAKVDLRTKKGVEQYVVTFQNDAITQRSKKTLYVLMGTDGKFISANHKLI